MNGDALNLLQKLIDIEVFFYILFNNSSLPREFRQKVDFLFSIFII